MQISPRYERSFIEPPRHYRAVPMSKIATTGAPGRVSPRFSRSTIHYYRRNALPPPLTRCFWNNYRSIARGAWNGWTAHRSYLFLPSCIIKRNIDRGNVRDATRALPARRKFEFALVSHETRFRSLVESPSSSSSFFCCCCSFFLSFFSSFLFLLVYLFIFFFFTKRFVGRFDSAYHASGIIKQRDNHIHARFFLQ